MKIQFQKKITTRKGLLVIPVFNDHSKKIPYPLASSIRQFISGWIKTKEFKTKKGEIICTYLQNKNLPEKLLVIGLGSLGKFNSEKSREIGAKIAKTAKKLRAKEISIILPPKVTDYIEEFFEGLHFAQYHFDLFKTSKKENGRHQYIQNMNIITDNNEKKGFDKFVKKAELIAEAMNFTKDMVNGPSNFVDAEYLCNEAKKIAGENKYEIEIFGYKELKKMAWGGLLAVNQGSSKEPQCVILKYFGAEDKNEKPLVIIGKGVIFDTGGYNLKPTNHIETMHQDMAGAATVLGIFKILRKLGIGTNIIGIMPMVENLVSATAYRPSDIIKMYSGKTVEITNTDAEGRLILADALTFGARMNPEFIITLATLTGAVAVALGDRYAGLIGNDIKLRRELQRAGNEVADYGWPLPLHPDFKMKLKSDIADLKNCDLGTQRFAGSSKGAAFLEKFVENKKWCHIDIGGTAFTNDPLEYQSKGATGHGLRMLVRFLEKIN